jgi:hypothetical protein
MPGGPARQLFSLEQKYISDSDLGQVIGDRAANCPATDNYDLRLLRQSICHSTYL